MALTELEALAARVRFDLVRVGCTPVAPEHEGGHVVARPLTR
ncbi:hypothetical protein ACWDUX_15715 [Streptomyces sp. NPDC003444]